jgi:RNA polymerase sigma-70 factor, ECF subfamily
MSAAEVPQPATSRRLNGPFAVRGPHLPVTVVSDSLTPSSSEELDRMYREFAPLVYRTAWGVLGNREDADDVVQTVFIGLLRRESLADIQNLKAYLYKAAITASMSVVMARRRRPMLVDDAALLEVPAPSEGSSFDEETYERLSRAIETLSADAAAVLLLRYLQNKSLTEIARKLGLSPAAVAVRLFRSRARLRALLHVSSEKKR